MRHEAPQNHQRQITLFDRHIKSEDPSKRHANFYHSKLPVLCILTVKEGRHKYLNRITHTILGIFAVIVTSNLYSATLADGRSRDFDGRRLEIPYCG